MKPVSRIFVFIAFLGCSTPRSENTTSTGNDTLVMTGEVESSFATDQPDSTIYVGYIQKFEDNNFFYTDLYFVENFNLDDYDKVAQLGDSVVYQDDETRRTRISLHKARKYFDLTGLHTITIYDESNTKLTTGRLHHVEYFEDMIENRFVAVFQVENPHLPHQLLFCMSYSNEELTPLMMTTFANDSLSISLTDHLNLADDRQVMFEHYRTNKLSNIYSTISGDTTSYITETSSSGHVVLYKSKTSETITDLTFISKKINGRPILLTDCGLPDTDMVWTGLLVFTGTEYEATKHQRIKK